ncbi:MAG: GNAT family N-acetyltransferase [Alphaproteobacteria bacterium]|nr:GNAT family N-acetyltransferase [Alphaproteobacteria bacterium]
MSSSTSPPPAGPSSQGRLTVELVDQIDRVPAADWDALTSPDDPFTTHAFLSCMEESGSVGRRSGWMPQHVVVRDGDALVAAMPLYVKGHSYGEYIFDWGWADAAQRAGIRYYPKLVSAVPFTPATGPRLLVGAATGERRDALRRALLSGALHLAKAVEASSLHVLFCTRDERDALQQVGLIGRTTHQFHWHNQGYADFDAWLSTFRSRRRKETRRERRLPPGVVVHDLRGDELSATQRAHVRAFYEDTCFKRGGETYLTPAFFSLCWTRLSSMTRVLLAEEAGEPVAMALLFQRGQHLYGRYWGCRPDHEALHFELCYHRPIELCIQAGWTRFEAGAQGHHKLKRGLLPAETWSAHWLDHAGLHRAVEDACHREAAAVQHQIQVLAAHGPGHREEGSDPEATG